MTTTRTFSILIIMCIILSGCKSSITDTSGGGTTRIAFSIPRAAYVTLWIENEYHSIAKTLLSNQFLDAGAHSVQFDGQQLPDGIYFSFLKAEFASPYSGTYTQSHQLLLLRQ